MLGISNKKSVKTVYFRAEGRVDEAALREILTKAVEVIDSYHDEKHLILADLRGLKPLAPKAAAVLGELIGYGRQHGSAYCVHLSDDTVARLQARRVAREVSAQDDGTIDVASLEEAEKVLAELRLKLRVDALASAAR
jgi:hypothetical protein